MNHPPGWYTDPYYPTQLRWWDGQTWTAHTSPTPEPARAHSAPEPSYIVPETNHAPLTLFNTAPTSADAARTELERLRAEIVETRELVLLQEAGLYEYSHPLDNSVEYRDVLKDLRQQIKNMVSRGTAVTSTKGWTVNGSAREGEKLVSDYSKLLLRAYNAEVEAAVKSLKAFTLDATVARVQQTRKTIAKLGKSMSISITDAYHELRIHELELTADYKAKLAEEKEREREERARLREEAAARKEFEREQARLEKERAHYQNALRALIEKGDEEAIQDTEDKLNELDCAIEGVMARSANIRAGYVYVISNLGAYGPGVVKIGMTRRLEPMDRVRELGGASVPFRFDVHALIFSDDAVGLEHDLHENFADRRLNLVNLRREYFYVTPREVELALIELQGRLLTFIEEPEALEWRQSETVRQARRRATPEG